jgi:hypothetical protein
MTRYSFLFIIVALLILPACSTDPLEVDVTDVETKPLKVFRLEDDLFNLASTDFNKQTVINRNKYGSLYDHYLMTFLNRGGSSDTLYKPSVLNYIRDKDVNEAYAYIKKLYPDEELKSIGEQADLCVKRFRFHFPGMKVPDKLVTCQSGWNYSFAYMDSTFLVALDMYLGDTAKFYKMLRLPQYQTRKMRKENILPDIARGWLLTEFDKSEPENSLLYHTIFYGKLFYGVEALLPETEDSLIIGYSSKQMKYCEEYEKNLWSYFAEKNRLYEVNLQTLREFTTEGPFTGAIHKECPPRIAMWVGWQIVRSYMKNNKKTTLLELMNEKDAQKILSKSKYRP